MLSRIHRGNNETSTYPTTQVPIRVNTQIPVRVTQFNTANPPNARQPTLPFTTKDNETNLKSIEEDIEDDEEEKEEKGGEQQRGDQDEDI